VSKAYKAGFEKLSQAADFIASVNCPLSLEEKQMLIQKQIDLLPSHDGDVAGLRIDLSLENPETGESKWVDATAVHTSCVSYRDKELKAVAKRKLSRTMGMIRQCPDILIQDPSPTLVDREALKIEKYSRLLMVAAKQHVEGKRISLPTFAPFAVSDFVNCLPPLETFKTGCGTVQTQTSKEPSSLGWVFYYRSTASVSAQIQDRRSTGHRIGAWINDSSSRSTLARRLGPHLIELHL
jgi:hypothetical protein